MLLLDPDKLIMAAAGHNFLNDDATTQQLELLRRQYFQLWEPDKLAIPSMGIMRLPEVQASIFESMFREDNLRYTPPDRYKTRVLKKLVNLIERAVVDPEEDVGFPCSSHLLSCHVQFTGRAAGCFNSFAPVD